MMDLNDDNFHIYAAKHYDRPHIISTEFEDDLKRIKYVKRLLKKYRMTGEIKERLILNHIIVLSNVFGTEASVHMLFYKCDPDDFAALKTMLLFLNFMPSYFRVTFNGRFLQQEAITVDIEIAKRLRNI